MNWIAALVAVGWSLTSFGDIQCDKVIARDEKLICSDKKLKALYSREEVASVVALTPDASVNKRVEHAREEWLKIRRACTTIDCLKASFRKRLADLFAEGEKRLMPFVLHSNYRENTPAMPNPLKYQGKILDSSCFEPFLEDPPKKSVSLPKCMKNGLDEEFEEENGEEAPWWETYRSYHRSNHSGIAYKYLGPFKAHYAILVDDRGGRERNVTLVDVQKEGAPKLILFETLADTFPPINAQIKDGNLRYTTSIHGHRYFDLVGLPPPNYGLRDVWMAADCDVAEFVNGKLARLFLLAHETPKDLSPEEKCLHDTRSKLQDSGKIELLPEETKKFVSEIGACLAALPKQ